MESDRITRIHQTPRYWLYVPDPETLPVPIEYIDVLRFTKTNVKGHESVVDCWKTDSDQVPGPWIGKTSFNIRVPNPKPGWVIQNGRPTKVEANSKRPEHIWSEEWKILTRKQRKEALQKWEVLQPKVESSRKERDLAPISKDDKTFWETLKKGQRKSSSSYCSSHATLLE